MHKRARVQLDVYDAHEPVRASYNVLNAALRPVHRPFLYVQVAGDQHAGADCDQGQGGCGGCAVLPLGPVRHAGGEVVPLSGQL